MTTVEMTMNIARVFNKGLYEVQTKEQKTCALLTSGLKGK